MSTTLCDKCLVAAFTIEYSMYFINFRPNEHHIPPRSVNNYLPSWLSNLC